MVASIAQTGLPPSATSRAQGGARVLFVRRVSHRPLVLAARERAPTVMLAAGMFTGPASAGDPAT
jgi:hypothetical protein